MAKYPPRDLGPHGRTLWNAVVSGYELTPTEHELLHALCSSSDQLQRLNVALKACKLVSTGSQGQLTGHPLLQEARLHSELVRRLVDQLDLPQYTAVPRNSKVNRSKVAHLTRREA
jgi:hypothetical protein